MAVKIRDHERRLKRLETLEETGCLVLIEDKDLSAEPTSISFDNIPQTYRHLWLWIEAKAADGGGVTLELTVNGDGGANYDWERMENATLYAGANDTKIKIGGTSGDEWVAHEVNIFNYASIQATQKRMIWKGARTRGAPPCVDCTIIQGGAIWDEIGAISSIQIASTGDGYDGDDSSFTLYGLC
jgi:hypothetical protein